jgi:hypothetical protein
MLGIVIEISRSRVVERSCVKNRCYTSSLLEVYVEDVNLRPDIAIRGKQRTVGWEGR